MTRREPAAIAPLHARDRRLIAVGFWAALAGFAMALIGVVQTQLVPFRDREISSWLHDLACRLPGITEAFATITWFGSFWPLAVLTVLGILYALSQSDWRLALVWPIVMIGCMVTVGELKRNVGRARPNHTQQFVPQEKSLSFPSGHSASSLCGYGLLGHVLGSRRRISVRFACGAIAAAWIAAIGFSRIYLGVHYPSDVFAGYCIGTAWLSAGLWWYERSLAKDAAAASRLS